MPLGPLAVATDFAREIYDEIGNGYTACRKADSRLARPLFAALGPGRVLNIQAGTGSYEPPDRQVVAAEPSVVMIRLQRLKGRSVTAVMVPHDCRNGMAIANWRRPSAYLDPQVWAGTSAFRQIAPAALQRGLGQLARGLRDGQWHQRDGHLLHRDEFDCGLRLLVGGAA
jgi:hypothetical protein